MNLVLQPLAFGH